MIRKFGPFNVSGTHIKTLGTASQRDVGITVGNLVEVISDGSGGVKIPDEVVPEGGFGSSGSSGTSGESGTSGSSGTSGIGSSGSSGSSGTSGTSPAGGNLNFTAANQIVVGTGTGTEPTYLNVAFSTLVGRKSTGDVDDLSASEVRSLLGLVIGTNVQAYSSNLTSWASKSVPSGAVVGTTDSQTLTNKTLTAATMSGATKANITSVGSTVVDCSQGTYFYKTVNSGTTFSFSNIPAAGSAYLCTLELLASASGITINFLGNIYWVSGTPLSASALTSGRRYLVMFVTRDGGSSWMASYISDIA
jgi:hypothetical protein